MNMPTIADVETTVFRLPLLGVLRWGKASSLNEARHVLIRVRLSDGSQGIAEAPPRPTIYGETVQSITSIVNNEFAPRLHGLTPEEARPHLGEIANNQTAKGALDMAIHGAVAQSTGLSLADHLESVQSKIRVSYILGIGDRETVLEEAASVYAQGVRVLKVKVGRNWVEDRARIEELQMIGADLDLYADANECFTPEEAADRLACLRDLGLHYCEEPLPVELVQERAALRAADLLPVIADDSCFSPRELRRELSLDTFHILNIKTARTGFSESIEMQAMAAQAGKGIMVGSQAGSGLGTVCAALFAARAGITHPSELSFFLKLREDILAEPLQLHEGYLALRDVRQARVDWDALRDATLQP